MDAIQKAPLIKYLLPLLAGIIFAYHFNIFSALEALGISLGFLTIFILIQMSILSQSYTHRWMPGLSISLCLFFTGIILIQSYELTSKSNFFGKAKENIYYYEYKILEPLQEKENTYKCRAEVQHIIYKKEAGSNNWYRKKTIGYVQLYFEKTPNSAMLKYGEIIYASQSPSAISPPVNPGEFDMQSYLKLKQIYHSSYLKDKDYLLLPNNHGNIFWKIVYNTKSKLSEYFNQHIKNKDELSIIKALVLGDEAEVSPELIDDYSASGTLHILSVSGLHIGILFYLLRSTLSRTLYSSKALAILGRATCPSLARARRIRNGYLHHHLHVIGLSGKSIQSTCLTKNQSTANTSDIHRMELMLIIRWLSKAKLYILALGQILIVSRIRLNRGIMDKNILVQKVAGITYGNKSISGLTIEPLHLSS
jgi:competence protein ComEC